MPTCCCCMNTLTRKRATPGMEMAKLHSISLANSSRWRSFIREWASCAWTSPVSFCDAIGLHGAVSFHARRKIVGDEQVRSARFAHGREQFGHVGMRLFVVHRREYIEAACKLPRCTYHMCRRQPSTRRTAVLRLDPSIKAFP